ncbi:MAG: hypothetical protein GX823_06000 [Clostridiales bacterium]|nr:hypothetical protein [Clostridiales bacterium]
MVKKLLLINLRALYLSVFLRRGKRSRGRAALLTAGIIVLLIYVVIAFATMIVMLFGELLAPFYAVGIGWMYFALNFVIVFALCVVTCIFTAQAQIFNARDNELLLSMPIKPSSILLARILSLLVIEYIFSALISIPVLAVWISGGYATVLGAVIFIVEFLLLQLPALAVACLLAWILTLVTSRLRKKNVVTLIVSLAFLSAYFAVYTNIQKYITTLLERGAELADAFRRGFPPLFYYGRAVSDGNLADLLIFAAFAIIPFAITIALLSQNFIKVATTKRGAKKIEYRAQALKVSSHITAVNKVELRRYWNNPSIIMNTSLGGIFAIIVGGYLLFARSSAASLMAQLGSLVPAVTDAVLVGGVLALTSSMNTAAAALISLEGKRLWIIRSMPVKGSDVLLGKLAMHLEISALPALLGSVLSIIALTFGDIDISGVFIVLLLPQVFILTTGAAGLIINLHMPKFDWLNELQPVKQGVPTVLVMFGTIAVIAGIAMLYGFALSSFLGITSFAWLLIIVLAVIDFLLVYWIVTRGARKFDALDA